MADSNQDDQGRGGLRERSPGGEREWRGARDWRDKNDGGLLESRYGGDSGRHESRAFGDPRREAHLRDPGEHEMRRVRDSGAGFGGGEQPNLDLQPGAGNYAPLNLGSDYGQDSGSFGPAAYDPAAYGSSSRRGQSDQAPHDPHQASYHHWRNTQLSSHDRDYARWREEQTRRYDEDYGSWRNERHSAFSKEFEGWRAGRGGQAGVPTSAQPTVSPGATPSSTVVDPSGGSVYGQSSATSAASGVVGYAHGAHPTLAKIAEGEDGRHLHHSDKAGTDQKPQRD